MNKQVFAFLLLSIYLVGMVESALADVAYWCDSGRTSNGDGSQNNPWKLASDINWTTVSNSAQSSITRLYFSSRSMWEPAGNELTMKATGSANFRYYMSGDEKYNTSASGTATWFDETTASRAIISNANFSLTCAIGTHDFTLRGFFFRDPGYSTITMSACSPTVVNVWNTEVYNCGSNTNTTTAGHGYGGDNFSDGCSNNIVRGCQFTNTTIEAVYMTKFDDLVAQVRGIVVESNWLVNCGSPGHEGDVDIKPGCYAPIIRWNNIFHTSHTQDAPFVGIAVSSANFAEVYNNTIRGAETNSDLGWGVGIYFNSDGDASTGKAITGGKIYNNLIYDCEQDGLKILATQTTAGADVSGLEIYNNTIWGNWATGITMSRSSSRTITISQFKNNIVGGNTNFDFSISAGVTLTSCNSNLYYRVSGNSFEVAGVSKNFTAWKALGYDAQGVNADPVLDGSFVPQIGSPAIGAAAPIDALFTNDRNGNLRTPPWDIGAFNFVVGSGNGTLATRGPGRVQNIGGL